MGGESRPGALTPQTSSYPQLAARPKGKQIHDIYRDRLRQFTDNGQYRAQGLLAKLDIARESGEPHVKLSVWDAPDLTRPTFAEATKKENKYRKTQKGESFGPSWSTHWFRVEFTLPSAWKGSSLVELHWDANNEGLVWTEDGKPLQGLTGGGERVEWVIPEEYRKYGTPQTVYIEMACNGMFGNAPGGDSIQPPRPDKYFQLSEADLVVVNEDARALYYDFWIIGDAAREFPNDSWEQHLALQVCNEIMDEFIAGEGSNESLKKCRKIATKYLGEHVDSHKVYDASKHALISGIGHCHIDTCWLWPWAETKRKVARSWSTQCNLLDRYPEHRFCASQAQQYKWLEQLYPHAFERVKVHVKNRRFQPIGGSWVEHDTNMPSGESLVRQFLYGQRYFQSRFGERCRTFWLPDTFGYSSQLPQICRLAGMTRFFTQKLSWNNINNFPHTTFNWVSLDGSQVICHMAPSETYTAEAHFGDVRRSVTQHKSMDEDPTSLLVFGKGDGGGGPTFGHIEKLRRCRGISDKIGLLPRVSMGGSVDDFFDELEKKAGSGETEFVTWYGELYFELHRGTYTTQANNKRNNRQAEVLLHDLEYLATLASIKGDKGYKYPKEEIDMMWESVLLCQFHDCLPGSSIEMCYDDSDELYEKVFATGEKAMQSALKALGFTKKSEQTTALAVNTLPWTRYDMPLDANGHIPGTAFYSATAGTVRGDLRLPQNWHSDLSNRYVLIYQDATDNSFILEHSRLHVKVIDGVITSLFDKKANRETVPPGKKSNQLVIFDDKPLYWQAWDVEVYHLQSRKELSASPSSTHISLDSPDKVAVTTTTQISSKSWIKTTISLQQFTDTPDSAPIVEISAEVEWHETMKFLKVEFPTSIRNTEASYETQYGIVRRPTHYNTSWDMAKFEVCCHKFADLSENGYGISILNDSKYGFATCGEVMRLSLLRAPKAPDAHADMGRHHIRWAILPHIGGLDHRTVRAAREFNHPFPVHHHPAPKSVAELFTAFKLTPESDKSLVVDVVKRAEDDADVLPSSSSPASSSSSSSAVSASKSGDKDKHIIVRIYDSLGGTSRGVLDFGPVKIAQAWKCNVLEDVDEEKDEMVVIRGETDGLKVELRAFEIATFKLLLA